VCATAVIVGILATSRRIYPDVFSKEPSRVPPGPYTVNDIPKCAQTFLWKQWFRFTDVQLDRIRILDVTLPSQYAQFDLYSYNEKTFQATIRVDFAQATVWGNLQYPAPAATWGFPRLLGNVAHELVHVWQRMQSRWYPFEYAFADVIGRKYNRFEIEAESVGETTRLEAFRLLMKGTPVCAGQ
jgi:hypothetical protein